MIKEITDDFSLKEKIDALIQKEKELYKLTNKISRATKRITNLRQTEDAERKLRAVGFIKETESEREERFKKLIKEKKELISQRDMMKSECSIEANLDDIILDLEKFQAEFNAKCEVSFKFTTDDKMLKNLSLHDIKKIVDLFQNNDFDKALQYAELDKNELIEKSINIYDVERI